MIDDPLLPMLNQIGDILKFAEKNAGKPLNGPVDPALEKVLLLLEDAVNKFQADTDAMIEKEGKNSPEIYERVDKHPELYSESEKRIIKHCRDLGVNATVLRVGILRALREKDLSKKRDIGPNTKKSIQKRRNRFKGMGGGDGQWKRL